MEPKKWKRISRKQLLDNSRMQIVEDIIELPTGEHTNYVRFAPATTHSVAVIAVNQADEVAIQREYSYPPNKVLWQLPGGGINEGEDVLDAANRELSEESGFTAKNCKLLGSFYINNRASDQRQFVVLCTDLSPYKLTHDKTEFIETHWLPVAGVHNKIKGAEFENVNLLAALNLWFHNF